MNKNLKILIITLLSPLFLSCTTNKKNENLDRAKATLDSLYTYYGIQDSHLLLETYPVSEGYKATYLASQETQNQPNKYSYLWPYSGMFSAINAIVEATGDDYYIQMLNEKVLPGLEEYFDNKRHPFAYSSYINSAPLSDRFYDDNVWIGIDFTDLYKMTKKEEYLDKAKLIWTFIESGTDDNLGGGIYWCEQKKESKNTCSNAPGAVYALKLFEATHDSIYFEKGKNLYDWTKKNLQDSTDLLYFDKISLDGQVDKTKYAYNSGQMLQSAVLLYRFTNEPKYLLEAQSIAKACHNHFFFDFKPKDGKSFRLINKENIWFSAVMLRGFIELYNQDGNKSYINDFEQSLNHAWSSARDEHGLFSTDFSGDKKDAEKWLLTQAAIVEMFARISILK